MNNIASQIHDFLIDTYFNVKPQNLRKGIQQFIDNEDINSNTNKLLPSVLKIMFQPQDIYNPKNRFGIKVREWQSIETAPWCGDTKAQTEKRFKKICSELGFTPQESEKCKKLGVIDDKYDQSTISKTKVLKKVLRKGKHWRSYEKYLAQTKGWEDKAISNIDISTDKILACIDNSGTNTSKGLVIGYVQSGKTANFIGLAAKAFDSGYNLVIVLAGLQNLLRYQTQKRFDKDLIGKKNPSVINDYKDELDIFNSFQNLEIKRISNKKDLGGKVKDFDHIRDSLATGKPCLAVIKKNQSILAHLISGINGTDSNLLKQVKCLIIDDESDQASINTKKLSNKESAINKKIKQLRELKFKSVHYAGFTATPYANVLIKEDMKDLFPSDFIHVLASPGSEYMGGTDFLSTRPNREFQHLVLKNSSLANENDDYEATLQEATDAWFLTGLIKLFEHKNSPRKRIHHTMLIHRGSSIDYHKEDKKLIKEILESGGYRTHSNRCKMRLKKLWEDDFKNSFLKSKKIHFEKLWKMLPDFLDISGANKNIDNLIKVINSNSADSPDFDQEQIWAILIGGNKLSRGFTVEGLTISCFSRKVKTTDTLLQMGRWFGYKKGFRHLVRLYLFDTDSPDLLESIIDATQNEQKALNVLRKYNQNSKIKLTPKDVPPLLENVSNNLELTSKNKLSDASIYPVYSQELKSITTPPEGSRAREHVKFFENKILSKKSNTIQIKGIQNKNGDISPYDYSAQLINLTGKELAEFMKSANEKTYRKHETIINYLYEKNEIKTWSIFIFNKKDKIQMTTKGKEIPLYTRSASRSKGYQAPEHVAVIKSFLSIVGGGTQVFTGDAQTVKSLKKYSKHGILLLYPVKQKNEYFLASALFYPEVSTEVESLLVAHK